MTHEEMVVELTKLRLEMVHLKEQVEKRGKLISAVVFMAVAPLIGIVIKAMVEIN